MLDKKIAVLSFVHPEKLESNKWAMARIWYEIKNKGLKPIWLHPHNLAVSAEGDVFVVDKKRKLEVDVVFPFYLASDNEVFPVLDALENKGVKLSKSLHNCPI